MTVNDVYERAGFGNQVRRGSRPALVVVDLTLGFTDPNRPTGSDLDDVVDATQRLLTEFREADLPVVFTTIVIPTGIPNAWVAKATGMAAFTEGSESCELDRRLDRAPHEPVITKHGASAFFGTDLAAMLVAAGADTVVLAGATTSGCVRATAVDSVQHGFPTLVVGEAVGDRASGPHQANLFDMQQKYADILSLDDAIGYVRGCTGAVPARSPRRIGLIVPSSNATMETELPALLARHTTLHGTPFTLHSSRSRLHKVDTESLRTMVDDGARCAAELADAAVEAIGYACLVAVMAEGASAHERIELDLCRAALNAGTDVPVVSSAGALVETIGELGYRKVAVVAPYVPTLTRIVCGYLEHYGIEVTDSVSLAVSDNLAVGRLPQSELPGHVARLDLTGAEAIVLSACVQMPSIDAIGPVERRFGLPVITAATATTRGLLAALGLPTVVPGAGAALAERVGAAA